MNQKEQYYQECQGQQIKASGRTMTDFNLDGKVTTDNLDKINKTTSILQLVVVDLEYKM